MIGEDAALSYALWYLDLKEADISDASSVFDNDFYDYYVRFFVGDDVYTCVISPYDGVFGRSTRDIGYNGAKEIAYNHAAQNIAEDQQEVFNNLMLGGLMTDCTTKAKGVASERTYEVKFSIGGFNYEYVIDGLSGNIVKINCEPDDKWSGEPVGGFDAATVSLAKPDIPDYFAEVEKTADTGDDGFIGEIAAIDIASGYARFNGFGIYDPVATLQNGEYYDVIFFTSGRELMHNSYIDALTGDILYSVVERKDFLVLPDFDLGEVTDDAGFIGEKLAVELAVEYAGHTTDDAYDIEVELKYSRGIEAYEVRYAAGEYEYEYTLKAEDGDVLRAVQKPAEEHTVEG